MISFQIDYTVISYTWCYYYHVTLFYIIVQSDTVFLVGLPTDRREHSS